MHLCSRLAFAAVVSLAGLACTSDPDPAADAVAVADADTVTDAVTDAAVADAAPDAQPGDVPNGEGCADTTHRTMLLGGGWSAPECAGGLACGFDVSIAPGPSGGDPVCDVVTLTWLGGTTTAPLTPLGHTRAREIARALLGADLTAFGACPSCPPGSDSHLSLILRDVSLALVYDTPVPAPLADADAFVQGLSSALEACQANELVVPGPDCVPAQ